MAFTSRHQAETYNARTLAEKSVQSDENVPLDRLRFVWNGVPSHMSYAKMSWIVFFEGKRTNQIQLRLWDTSQLVYADCVYVAVQKRLRGRSPAFFTGTAKVASLETQSIPLLDLCGALHAPQSIPSAVELLRTENLVIPAQYVLKHSIIILNWLNTLRSCQATFILNHVALNQEKSSLRTHVIINERQGILIPLEDLALRWGGLSCSVHESLPSSFCRHNTTEQFKLAVSKKQLFWVFMLKLTDIRTWSI